MSQQLVPDSPLELLPWQICFYNGERLAAEVKLFAAKFNGKISLEECVKGSTLLHTSFGTTPIKRSLSPFQEFQATFSEPQSLVESRSQYLSAADCPDALLFWVLVHFLPSKHGHEGGFRIEVLRRLALLLMQRFPKRPDLPYQLLMLEPTGHFSRVLLRFTSGQDSGIQMPSLFSLSYRSHGCKVVMSRCG